MSRQTSFLALQLSQRLAAHAPQLTLDFLSEVAVTMEKNRELSQKLHCLQYVSPWVRNLVCFVDPTNPNYEHSGARLRDCIRVLLEMTLAEKDVSHLHWSILITSLRCNTDICYGTAVRVV